MRPTLIARHGPIAIAAGLLLLLATSMPTLALAQDAPAGAPWATRPNDSAIKIEGPETIEAGEYAQLFVRGVPASSLPTARVIHFPRERTVLMPAQTWGGDPFVLFKAKTPGKYLVAVVLAGGDYAEVVVQVGDPPPPPPPPVPPTPNPYLPAPEWKATVQPVLRIKSLKSQPENAKALAECFDWTASSVAGATAGLATYGDLRSSLASALAKQDLKGKVPGLGTALDAVLAEALGLDNVAIDRPKTAAVLRTIAWAIFETGHAQ